VPIEPPICWPVVTIADATGASPGSAPSVAVAIVIPMPKPATCRSARCWSTPARRSWPKSRPGSPTARPTCCAGAASSCGSRRRSTASGQEAVTLSDGTHIANQTLVWTAGVSPNPALAGLGLTLGERGRVVVDSCV
jgi:hypothetical protein